MLRKKLEIKKKAYLINGVYNYNIHLVKLNPEELALIKVSLL